MPRLIQNTVSIFVYGLSMILLLSMFGCATGPCPTARQVMADRGYVVLKCRPRWYPDTEGYADACYVADARGNVTLHTIFVRHCGL